MIYIIWMTSLIVLYVFMRKKEEKRIDDLLELVERLNRGDYKIPMKQDRFAMLEDQIYKLFMESVETRENMKKLTEIQIENLENIAHQIKTPIMTMLFNIDSLKEKNSIEGLENIEFQLKRLNSLSDILLKISSLDMNIDNMKNEKIYLEDIFYYVTDILEHNIKTKNISLKENLKNIYIYGDYYWICEAFINIIKNSTEQYKCSEINISAIENPVFTEIIIEDDGEGIKEEYLKKIFERFYKTPDSKGFGVGLSMAKSVIEKNNGEIRAENGEKGAKFIIKFYKVNPQSL